MHYVLRVARSGRPDPAADETARLDNEPPVTFGTFEEAVAAGRQAWPRVGPGGRVSVRADDQTLADEFVGGPATPHALAERMLDGTVFVAEGGPDLTRPD